jgi:hypothetical protein
MRVIPVVGAAAIAASIVTRSQTSGSAPTVTTRSASAGIATAGIQIHGIARITHRLSTVTWYSIRRSTGKTTRRFVAQIFG